MHNVKITGEVYGEPDDGAVPDVVLSVPQTEAAAIMLLVRTDALIRSLARLIGDRLPGDKIPQQIKTLGSDTADNTVVLARALATAALEKMDEDRTRDPNLVAVRHLTQDYWAALGKVRPDRDSAPGVELACRFMHAMHLVLHAETSPAQKGEALVKWKEHKEKILCRC